jgi:hypothetical protein
LQASLERLQTFRLVAAKGGAGATILSLLLNSACDEVLGIGFEGCRLSVWLHGVWGEIQQPISPNPGAAK